MFKAWFNRRGYKNIFYFIARIHSPSLMMDFSLRKEMDKRAISVGLKRIKAKEPHIKWLNK